MDIEITSVDCTCYIKSTSHLTVNGYYYICSWMLFNVMLEQVHKPWFFQYQNPRFFQYRNTRFFQYRNTQFFQYQNTWFFQYRNTWFKPLFFLKFLYAMLWKKQLIFTFMPILFQSKIPGYRFTKALTQIVKLRNYFLLL